MSSMLDRFNLCELCKKPISDNTLCNDCNKIRKKAQLFANENDVTTKDISGMFGIPEKLLEKWVWHSEFKCKAPCRSCGKMVNGGNICADCRYRFASELRP